MTHIDKFKDVWKNQEVDKIKYSYNDIQKMLHKKSSSIVKWIFYISLIEFGFWSILSFTLDPDWNDLDLKFRMHLFLGVLNSINYLVIAFFIVLFYRNFKSISASSNTKKLMSDILKTRRTVLYYVMYNVGMLIIGFAVILYFVFTSDNFINKLQLARPDSSLNSTIGLAIFISIIVIAIVVGILLLFYRLIYGILLKQLLKNYKELSKN